MVRDLNIELYMTLIIHTNVALKYLIREVNFQLICLTKSHLAPENYTFRNQGFWNRGEGIVLKIHGLILVQYFYHVFSKRYFFLTFFKGQN